MTTLTLSLARALSRTWRPGDEVLVTRLDHDANISPWIQAASDAGATVRHVAFRPEDCTLDLDDLRAKLSEKTRLVAAGCASNAVGTISPVGEIVAMAHGAGAKVFLDAVHFAPHALMDVEAWDCDFLACSAYKFFGPHVGVLYGKRELLASLPAYKLRPSPEELPHRWETGTQSHEGIAGTLAAIDYLASLGRAAAGASVGRRAALAAAFDAIRAYELGLSRRLLEKLSALRTVKVFGITDGGRLDRRTPTFSFTHERKTPLAVAQHLAREGIFVWSGHFYALAVTEALGLEPSGLVRVGLLHYNTAEEIERLGKALAEID
jgi:cysteine desulfurase family protein (TIGR01976 family)